MRMRILTRYILSEVLSHAAIGAVVFTFVIFTRDLGRILELVVRNSAPLPSVAEIFFLTVPTALTVTIPMGVLVGILIGLSRLAADSEVTAMRASGLGVSSFVRVLSIFVVVAWALALFNNVVLAPKSAAALGRLQDRLKNSQASFEIQPRVFYENFQNLVLYVQDVSTTSGTPVWKGVFVADISNPAAPRIILAKEGMLINEGADTLRLHLMNGSQHESDPNTPEQYSITTFAQTDLPVQVPVADTGRAADFTPVAEVSTSTLLRPLAKPDPTRQRWYEIEFHRRLALPTACLVLAVVGIPLGLSARKGGKSTGFVLTIALVFLYYFLFLSGLSLAKQGRLSPAFDVWLANIVFFVCGVALLWRMDRMPFEIASARAVWGRMVEPFRRSKKVFAFASRKTSAFDRAVTRKRVFHTQFPSLLDDLIVQDFFTYVVMILATFLLLLLVFTFFELLSDILHNQVSPLVVIEYLANLTPYLVYQLTPLSVLLAVLVTFGLMQKANEVTAMKASGISIYRVVFPVLVISAILAGGLFFFDQLYLPHANQRQDELRNRIKGKPAQTYLRPDRKWIFGAHSTIYYYRFFDPDRDQFGSISAFQFDPQTFEFTHRIYAARAHWQNDLHKWVYEKGWERAFRGPAIQDYSKFDAATFAQSDEPPQYFKKEVKQSSEMSYDELSHYIGDLQQGGYDVVRLRVQLQKKLAFPIITFVMAILAVPFALSAGRKGALTGVAISIGVAVIYWTVSSLFEAMGNLSQLPPALAAWSPDLIFALAGGYLILKVPT